MSDCQDTPNCNCSERIAADILISIVQQSNYVLTINNNEDLKKIQNAFNCIHDAVSGRGNS